MSDKGFVSRIHKNRFQICKLFLKINNNKTMRLLAKLEMEEDTLCFLAKPKEGQQQVKK